MSDLPVLVGVEGVCEGRKIQIPQAGLSIGRAEENDLVIEDDDVSRFHASLQFDNGTLWVKDAGSRNGVFVNDVRVTGHKAVKLGDKIRLGDQLFLVQWASDESFEARKTMLEVKLEEPPVEKKKKWYWPF